MKKLILILLIIIYASFASAQIAITENSLNITEEPGKSISKTINVNNQGTGTIPIAFTPTRISDNDNDSVTFTLTPLTLNPGNNVLTFTASLNINLDLGRYTTPITITSGSFSDNFNLILDAEPVICDFGIVGSDLSLEIKDPDLGDDFEPGDTVHIKVKVDNKGQRDMDVQVEAALFSDEDFITSSASNSKSIDSNDDEDFDFNLEIPLENSKLDRRGDLTLFVKAFDDDNERFNCIQSSLPIDLDLEKNKVIINKLASRINPPRLMCGETGSALIKVANIGDERQDDVVISIKNSKLNINSKTSPFKLDDFDASNENQAVKSLDFTIPNHAKPGTYLIDALVDFDGGSDSDQFTLVVDQCKQTEFVTEKQTGLAKVESLEEEFSVIQGSQIQIPFKITNMLDKASMFTISLTNTEDFALTPAAKTLNFAPFQTLTTFIALDILENAKPGKYLFTLEVKENNNILVSKNFDMHIKEIEKKQEGLTTTQWILLNALLVVLVVAFLVRLLIKRR